MNKKLHIISFDIPYPPNYGGIIDIYYKVAALQNTGAEIILHCFEYNRKPAKELEKLCEKVFYYNRRKTILKQLSFLPFIVKTRNHPELLKNLLADPAPILFEGLHTCYFLNHPKLRDYKKLVRTHNIEHEYYHYLWKSEKEQIPRFYYLLESFKLKFFERRLKHADYILPISIQDTDYFSNKYGKTISLPAFHPFSKVSILKGTNEYALFHGNLSVAENLKSVTYLIEQIFTEITIPFIIAGKNPPEWLVKKIKNIPHISLVINPNAEEMDKLVQNAQICLIPTFQPTGLKLKLLSSLFGGRHCITNSTMVQGTGLEDLCHIGNSPEEFIRLIQKYIREKFTQEDIRTRERFLEEQFSNEKNARTIMKLL